MKPAISLDPRTYERALSCVHCGLCLPACPTYLLSFNEADSPRGRIQLMRGMAGGTIDATAAVRKHLDLCLDCRGCETACPSGVVYHELIEETRSHLKPHINPFLRWMLSNIVVHPTRLKLALLPVRIFQRLGIVALLRNLFPPSLRQMERMLPPGPLWPTRLDSSDPQKMETTSFFTSCVGSVMFGQINQQAADLLAAGGMSVSVPKNQCCCGAIHHHNGDAKKASQFARRNIDAFPGNSPIVSTVAGCGAMLRDYPTLLRDDPKYADRACAFSQRVRDISEVLVELKLPLKNPVNLTATYHDACHLAHAQKVTEAPRKLLERIPGLTIVPLAHSDLCCGAAGTYNLVHPQTAAELGDRKLDEILSTGALVCAAGNAGCSMHLQNRARQRGLALEVMHPVELLHRAMVKGSR